MLRGAGGWAWALWLAACSPTPEPHPHPVPVPRPDQPAVPIPLAPDEEPALDGYGAAFVSAFTAAKPLGKRTHVYGPGEAESIQHWVLQFEPEGDSHHYLTAGFGRIDQRHAFGSTPHRLELLAVIAADQDADVVNVLSRLGGFMHSAERAMSERFAEFQTLRMEEPVAGMHFFVLVPAGETKVEGELVTVLRVIPIAEEEYAHLRMRGDGASRAWWNRTKADPATARRWSSAVPIPFVPD